MTDLYSIFANGSAAAATSGMLFAGALRSSRGLPLVPSRAACAGFGAAHMVGAWMLYDGDTKNGAGFTTIWSALFQLAGARSLTTARGLYPKAARLVAAVSAVGYCTLFLTSGPAKPMQADQTIPDPE